MGKMAEVQRRLLEQMMGAEAMGLVVTNYEWYDEKVCKNYLFGACPHTLFANTKIDLGQCPKVHSEKILSQFQEALINTPQDPRISRFRQEHENTLYAFVDDCDRRIRASQRKLEKTPEENRKTVEMMREIGEIELSIQGGTEEIEALGEAGKVEESMQKLAAVDALKAEKAAKERDLQDLNENAGASGHQKLRVCEICGAMLSVLDSDKRLADHFGGKLHLGYQEVRKLISQLAEARMTGKYNAPNAPSTTTTVATPAPYGAPAAPSGPRGIPGAPSGPSSNGSMPPPNAPSGPGSRNMGSGLAPGGGRGDDSPGSGYHTPLHHPRVPPPEEMPHIGHGDKGKREAGELVEDVKDEKEKERDDKHGRSESREYKDKDKDRSDRDDREGRGSRDKERERERYGGGERDREREREKDRYRDEKYEKYEKYERSSRYDDRDRRDRDRERKYEDDRSSKAERSRSPPKRRLV